MLLFFACSALDHYAGAVGYDGYPGVGALDGAGHLQRLVKRFGKGHVQPGDEAGVHEVGYENHRVPGEGAGEDLARPLLPLLRRLALVAGAGVGEDAEQWHLLK